MSQPTRHSSLSSVPLATGVAAGLGVLLFATLCLKLWPEWTHDPDLSHALFMPVVFAYLMRESREGTPRYLPDGSWPLTVILALAGLLTVLGAALYAAALGWSASVVDFSLTAGYCLLGSAVLTALSASSVRAVPLNWSSLCALGLWMLCAPIPPGSYSRLTQSLQLGVTGSVLHTLHILGIAAHQTGNVIELANASVGIEDACSGIRSLVSCVFTAFFFSASLVRAPWARALLVAASVPLALVMNFLRSLTLTLLTNHGIAIAGAWHDLTGYSVLAVTAVLLAGFAFLFSRAGAATGRASTRTGSGTRTARIVASVAVIAALVGTGIAYKKTRPIDLGSSRVPDLESLLPAHPPGWTVSTRNDLYRFEGTLRTDHLIERTYVRQTPEGLEQVTLYVAYWGAGQAPVSIVAMHTPDACWPGTGWEPQPAQSAETQPVVAGRPLPTAQARLFIHQDFPQYVWFWHLYAGRSLPFQNAHSALALLRMAWNFGFARDGDQFFIRVSSNRPWKVIANDPLITGFFEGTRPLGL